MSKCYALDFDGTLFDIEVVWQGIVDRFVQEGLVVESVIEKGESLFSEGYSIRKHAQRVGLNNDSVEKITQELEQTLSEKGTTLVYPDVVPFLLSIPLELKSILTFGEEVFQKTKIRAANLESHIGNIRIAGPEYHKTAHLKEMLEVVEHPLVFIDDNPRELLAVHNAGIPVDLVRIRRKGARHAQSDHELDNEAWRVIQSFDELE